jgi:glycosyltransferase involved in cell wall biosynthesis
MDHGQKQPGGILATPRRPRIGLDLHVVEGLYQGSRTHCLELFSRVIQMAPELDFVLFLDQPAAVLQFSQSFALSNVRIVRMPNASPAKRLLVQLPQLARHENVDLLHTQYIVPPLISCPCVVTVHDILFESHPEFFGRLFVARSRLLVRRSVRKSAEVFTVSDFSKQQIVNRYGVSPDRIHTIFNGVDEKRFFPGDQGHHVVRKAGLLPGEYFLTVGRLEPRKNHANLLRAWAALPTPRPRLVFIGQRHFGYDEALQLRESLNLTGDVVLLENIQDEELPSFFRHAKGFVYCSWAEGFGMPVLEAMASGIPVISSSTTALSEICGNAALLVDPANPLAIRDAVVTMQAQAEMRAQLIQRGLERMREFDWERAARKVRHVYLSSKVLGLRSQ